ncbi:MULTISPECIES: hypothetical protein [unclassified Pseudoalteromonas]|uniref:hypothetical protein n=1 Tax=unclassified Pseudoalteromonas TaxID=194690 RepID=UPI001486855C|nr:MULTISPECIES: hypothetical protein [unclassified Pseudoalteromonas]
MTKFILLKFITFFIGCLSCFLMHTTLALPIVVSAGLTGLIGSFIPFPADYKNHPYAAIYAGSFAGMCSTSLINEYWEIAIISAIGAVLYTLTINVFAGFGGRLGSIAFASVALFVLAKELVI